MKTYKCVLLGTSAVGKSTFVLRWVKNEYMDRIESTIGAAFFTKNLTNEHKLEIWDTAGQERYNSLAPMYYRKAQYAIIMFDICDETTFQQAKEWVKEIRKNTPKTEILFVGNKIDLP